MYLSQEAIRIFLSGRTRIIPKKRVISWNEIMTTFTKMKGVKGQR
jgi:hypothetical protein